MNALLGGAAALLGFLALVWWFTRADPKRLARALRILALLLGGGVGAWLLFSGRYPWLPIVLIALLPYVSRLWSRAPGGGSRPSGGQSSTVEARFLRLTLDHATGALDGRVLEGAFAGRRLSDLMLPDAIALWRECAADEPSLRLMESYLDRAHGASWRKAAGEGSMPPRGGGDGPMTKDEARAVLGVGKDATEAEIEAAFRRVMRRAHPDQGGSDWLAAKVNRARDVLLRR